MADDPRIGTPDHADGPPVWAAPLLAVPPAALLTVVAGATEIPWEHLSWPVFGGAVLLGLADLPRILWAPLAFPLLVAALLVPRPASRSGRRLRAAGLALLGVLAALQAYLGLRADPTFARGPWFAAPYAGLAVLGAAWALDLARRQDPGAGRSRWRRRLSAGLGPGLIVVAAGLHAANRTLLLDGYHAWHLSLCRAGFLLLVAGLASAALDLGLVRRPWARRRTAVAIWAGTVALLLLAAVLPVRSALADRTASRYHRFTALGTSALFHSGSARAVQASAAATPMYDPAGERTFARLSRLPALPRGFVLDDYNLLLVSLEALRYRDTSLGDPDADRSPNLRRFSEDPSAFSFARAFAPAPATLQVFASMFGMAPVSFTRVGLWKKWFGRLPEETVTVAEILAANGWRTFYAGHNHKHHFGEGGFIQGLHQGFDDLDFSSPPDGEDSAADVDERVAAAAVRALEGAARSGERFFGWVFLSSTHEPHFPRYPGMPAGTRHELYLQQVRFIDAKLGIVLDHLRRSGLLDKTVVVVHGDHGEAFADHGFFGHSGVYVETLHVPLVVRVPGVAGGGEAGAVSTAHVLPWLLERGPEPVRAAALEAMRARFAPAMERTGGAVIAEQVSPEGIRTALIADRGWLIHDHPSGDVEIYDMQRDRRQKKDLAERETPLVREMLGRLDAWLEVRGSLGVPLDEHIVERPDR